MLMLLVVGAAAAVWGGAIVYRWNHNMTHTVRIVPGERVFAMPPGVIPRGGELIIPKEQRGVAAKQANPGEATQASGGPGEERGATVFRPGQGAGGGHEVHPDAGPDERGSPEAADRRLLAQLHRGRRRRDALVRRGAVDARGLAHRELPAVHRAEMTVFWGLVAALGAVVFL